MVSQRSGVQLSNRFSIYPLSFQTLANSFAFFKVNPFVFKQFRTLYRKTPPPGVPTTFQRSNIQTFKHSDIPALPIRPIAAERFRCNNSQSYGISSRSEETTPLSSVSKTSERTSGTARVGFQGLYLQTSEQNGPLRKKAWVQRSKR